MTTVRIKKLHPNAVVPSFATVGDAGADLRATEAGHLEPGERTLVPTGIAIELPLGTVGLVHPRSGLAAKHGVTVLNTPGTIDAGYRGEVKVILHNAGQERFSWDEGDRVAQLVIQQHLTPSFVEADELDASVRGAGGFGSTGA